MIKKFKKETIKIIKNEILNKMTEYKTYLLSHTVCAGR